jgi:hypothetical protein
MPTLLLPDAAVKSAQCTVERFCVTASIENETVVLPEPHVTGCMLMAAMHQYHYTLYQYGQHVSLCNMKLHTHMYTEQ